MIGAIGPRLALDLGLLANGLLAADVSTARGSTDTRSIASSFQHLLVCPRSYSQRAAAPDCTPSRTYGRLGWQCACGHLSAHNLKGAERFFDGYARLVGLAVVAVGLLFVTAS
jgi:hypothetical protein